MTSFRNFLARRDDGTLRMTRGQVDAVRRAVQAALFRYERSHADAMTSHEEAFLLGSAKIVDLALNEYVADRSCYTCDFLNGDHCLHWKQDVPDDAADAGCGEHATDGAPF